MNHSIFLRGAAALLIAGVWSSPSFGGDDYVFDVELVGEDGAPGAAGEPATNGESGDAGQSLEPGLIVATPTGEDTSFDVLLIAGSGGAGGQGGNSSVAGAAPGSGGDGGHGGSLTTQMTFVGGGTDWGRAALGGFAGRGGNGGDAGAGSGARGGNGGDGGDIESQGSGDVAYEQIAGIQHLLTAGDGGHGGNGSADGVGGSGGRGGNVRIDSRLINSGVGEAFNGAELQAGSGGDATQGGAGGAGGSVVADRLTFHRLPGAGMRLDEQRSGSSTYDIGVRATGGDGGSVTDARAGDGGSVIVTEATTTVESRFSADIFLTLTGGNGGNAHGSGRAGDGAAVAVTTASATNNGTGDGFVELDLTGGSGGNGFGQADAGNGASVIADGNAAVDAGRFASIFNRITGGAAGDSEDGLVGRAGDATHRAAQISAVEDLSTELYATGGEGGDRRSATGMAGAGGDALADASAINTGGRANAGAYATGGHGGLGFLGAGDGRGGLATGLAYAQGSGDALAVAEAATSMGGESAFGVSTTAGVRTTMTASAMATAAFDSVEPTARGATDQAWTRATALPNAADVTALIQSNPNVAINFDLSGGSDLFGYASIGAGYQNGEALDSYAHTATFSIDVDYVPESQNLLVGFLDATVNGDDFGNFLMTVSVGTEVLLAAQGDSAAAVDDLLDDRTYDLGSLASLAGMDGLLELEIDFILAGAAAGQGIAFELVVGNSTLGIGSPVPLPGAFWLLLTGLLALVGRSARPR